MSQTVNLLKYVARECPPDKWRWQCPRTGHRIEEMDRQTWFAKIKEFNDNNGFALEEGWQAIAEHQLCQTLEPGFCMYEDGSKPVQFIDTRSTLDVVIAATKVFLAFVQNGGKLVAPEVAEARAKTCAACFAKVPMQGCGACHGLASLVMDIVGKGKTSSDVELANKQCAWCKCAALPNAWTPVEVSEAGVTDAMLAHDAVPEWCWKAAEIRELRKNAVDIEGQQS